MKLIAEADTYQSLSKVWVHIFNLKPSESKDLIKEMFFSRGDILMEKQTGVKPE